MNGSVKKIENVYPVTVESAVYVDDTNETIKDKLKTMENFVGNKTDLSVFGYDSLMPVIMHLLTSEAYGNATLEDIQLTELEQTLYDGAVKKINTLNPDGKYMMFGFFSDLHQCTEGVEYADNGIVEHEQTMKLLAYVANTIGLDAVFCGGDLINGRELTKDTYTANYATVEEQFKKYFEVPTYIARGNHDSQYSSSADVVTNEEWKDYIVGLQKSNANAELHYIPDSNTFYVDFPKYKIRIIVFDEYYNSIAGLDGIDDVGMISALTFEGNKKAEEWIVGLVYHTGARPVLTSYEYAFVNGSSFKDYTPTTKGLGTFGAVCGHLHSDNVTTANGFSTVQVACALATQPQLGTEDGYCFSIFIVDTDNKILREIRVGRGDDREFSMLMNE